MWTPRRRRRYTNHLAGSLDPDAPVLTIEFRTLPDHLCRAWRGSGRRDVRGTSTARTFPGQMDVTGYMHNLASPLRSWYERESAGLAAAINQAANATRLPADPEPTGQGGPVDRARAQVIAQRAAVNQAGYTAADRLLALYNTLRAELLSIEGLHEQGQAAYCQGTKGAAQPAPWVLPPWFTQIRADVTRSMQSLDIPFPQGETNHD